MAETDLRVVGIDLGTTYSCIANVDDTGRPVVIPNYEGGLTTPSVVFFDGENRVVGQEAKNVAKALPDQVVEMVKRNMGSQDWRYFYNDEEYTPEEISSYIVRKVVADAEQYVGFPIKDVVITCPAYFGITERDATRRAGEIAGLNVLSIVNEPIAAAIAYGFLESQDQVVLVYDLGGGTFDVTLIEIKGGAVTVIATGGDHQLGGRQWDEIVVNYVAEQWLAEHGGASNPMDDPHILQDLFARAEDGKKAVSSPRGYTDISVLFEGQRTNVRLTREKFDELTGHLLERTISYTRDMLAQAADKGYTRFDDVLLVGGSARMPQVKERVAGEFAVEPKLFDPDQAVAKGAAIYAYKLAFDREFERRFGPVEQLTPQEVQDRREALGAELPMSLRGLEKIADLNVSVVTSRSFGVIAWMRIDGREEEKVSNLIRVQTPLPTTASDDFGTYEAAQTHADIRYVENISHDAVVDTSISSVIGTALLTLPPNLPAGSPIEITFRLDEQGLLHATAREMTTNAIVAVQMQTEGAMSAEELAQAKARSGRLVVS